MDDGTIQYVTMERADEPVEEGTPINKVLFDLLQESVNNDINNQYVVGSYTGDASESGSQLVELGFTPRMVYVQQQTPSVSNNTLYAGCFGLALQNYPMKNRSYNILNIEENGFRVYQSQISAGYCYQNTNQSGQIYMYIAFK